MWTIVHRAPLVVNDIKSAPWCGVRIYSLDECLGSVPDLFDLHVFHTNQLILVDKAVFTRPHLA